MRSSPYDPKSHAEKPLCGKSRFWLWVPLILVVCLLGWLIVVNEGAEQPAMAPSSHYQND